MVHFATALADKEYCETSWIAILNSFKKRSGWDMFGNHSKIMTGCEAFCQINPFF